MTTDPQQDMLARALMAFQGANSGPSAGGGWFGGGDTQGSGWFGGGGFPAASGGVAAGPGWQQPAPGNAGASPPSGGATNWADTPATAGAPLPQLLGAGPPATWGDNSDMTSIDPALAALRRPMAGVGPNVPPGSQPDPDDRPGGFGQLSGPGASGAWGGQSWGGNQGQWGQLGQGQWGQPGQEQGQWGQPQGAWGGQQGQQNAWGGDQQGQNAWGGQQGSWGGRNPGFGLGGRG